MRQRDEGHHPGLPRPKLACGAADEHQAPVQEHDRAKDRGQPIDPGQHRQLVAQPHRDVVAEQDDRDRQGEAQPELVAEHRDGVAGVLVVATGVSVMSGRRARGSMTSVGGGGDGSVAGVPHGRRTWRPTTRPDPDGGRCAGARSSWSSLGRGPHTLRVWRRPACRSPVAFLPIREGRLARLGVSDPDRRAGIGRGETHVVGLFTNRGCECATAPPADRPDERGHAFDDASPDGLWMPGQALRDTYDASMPDEHSHDAARARRPRAARAALLPRRRRGAELHAGGRAAAPRPAGALRLGQAARGPARRRPLRADDAAGRADVRGRGPGRGGACRDGGGDACARDGSDWQPRAAPAGSRSGSRPPPAGSRSCGTSSAPSLSGHPTSRSAPSSTTSRTPRRASRGRGRRRLHLRPTAGRGSVGRDHARRAAPARGRPGAPVGTHATPSHPKTCARWRGSRSRHRVGRGPSSGSPDRSRANPARPSEPQTNG